MTTNEVGQPLDLRGASRANSIVFNDEGTLAFIAGFQGKIYVFDTSSQSVVHTIQLNASTSNIASLAISGAWLYVSEGGYSTGGV